MKDISYVPPTTNPCPVCGIEHRLLTQDFIDKMKRLGMDDDDLRLLQEESDELASAYGCPDHTPQSPATKREATRERVRKHRAAKRAKEE